MDRPRPSLPRRRFLQTALFGGVAPFVVPSRVWSAEAAPSERLGLGFIGMGKMNGGHLGGFLSKKEVQVRAVCDVDTNRREHAQARVNQAYAADKESGSYKDCGAYSDFRELLARDDIDAVVIATPDHWHAITSIAAVEAGKDVYCEKPLTHNIHEAVVLVQKVREHERVFQTGSQQRSSAEFRVACELVRNGVIGKVERVETSFGDPAPEYHLGEEEMEPGLDWDMWCGPGPLVGYHSSLSPRGVHDHFPNWRMTREFGGGMVTDWGAHHVDIAQWGLGCDGSGPVRVHHVDVGNPKRGAQLVYESGVTVTHDGDKGVSFYGADGEVHVNRGRFELVLGGERRFGFWDREVDTETSVGREVELARREFLEDAEVKLYESGNHQNDWLDCIKNRSEPICDVAIGASTVISCHLMNLIYYHGQAFGWNPSTNGFSEGGDPAWLTREFRGEWKV